MGKPLDGVRVVDLSQLTSGPLATMVLAEQGADVVKVEPPGLGDIFRLERVLARRASARCCSTTTVASGGSASTRPPTRAATWSSS